MLWCAVCVPSLRWGTLAWARVVRWCSHPVWVAPAAEAGPMTAPTTNVLTATNRRVTRISPPSKVHLGTALQTEAFLPGVFVSNRVRAIAPASFDAESVVKWASPGEHQGDAVGPMTAAYGLLRDLRSRRRVDPRSTGSPNALGHGGSVPAGGARSPNGSRSPRPTGTQARAERQGRDDKAGGGW
jgi:hypothetical protein